MKKLMKFAAMLASAVMLCGSSLTVHAEVLPFRFYGVENNTYGFHVHQMQVLDDKGWIQYRPEGGIFRKVKENTSYYILTYHPDDLERSNPQYYIWFDPLYMVVPQQDMLQYVLRTDIDQNAAKQQAAEIVQKYFPEQKHSSHGANNYQIIVSDTAMRTAERADGLMRELAGAGLISEFYTLGEVAQYLDFDHGLLTSYNANGSRTDKENGITYDWAAIETWVRAHHPECEFVCITDKDSELCKKLGISYWTSMFWDDTFYAVIPPEEAPFADHFALAMELYEQFNLQPCARPSGEDHELYRMFGKNGLEVAGDANLDCSVDVADAVLAARFAAEDREAVITDQGKENADVNGDGNVTTDDTELILKKIAKKI